MALHPCACISHLYESVMFIIAPSHYDIAPMASRTALVHKVECPHVGIGEGKVAPCPVPLQPRVAHHTYCGALVWAQAYCLCAMAMPKAMPQCPLSAAKALRWCPPWVTYSTPSTPLGAFVAPSCHGIVPMASWTTSMHKTECPCGNTGREGCTMPCTILAMGCTPHMSWSPCVHASMLFVCYSHAQGHVLVSTLSHLPSLLKEQFKLFWTFLE